MESESLYLAVVEFKVEMVAPRWRSLLPQMQRVAPGCAIYFTYDATPTLDSCSPLSNDFKGKLYMCFISMAFANAASFSRDFLALLKLLNSSTLLTFGSNK